MSPSLPLPELASARLPGIRLSDRLLQRLARTVAARPYLAGSVALHALLAVALLNAAGLDARERTRATAAEAARTAQRLAQTQARELRHRVERMQAIRAELDPGAKPLPPAAADVSPDVLAQRAQQLAEAIDAADREERAATLARLMAWSLSEARARLAKEDASQPRPPPAETAAQKIARLERRARDIAETRRARLDAQREGLRVTGARASPASGSTGQTHVADGIPRSRTEQLKAMVRLGGPQGRVGVVGTEGGLSVNREHVRGIADGRHAKEDDFGRDGDHASRRRGVVLEGQREPAGRNGGAGDHGSGAAKQGGRVDAPADVATVAGLAAVRIPGHSLDLTGHAEDGRHELVRVASPPMVDVATLHTAAGRVFGPGGTYAERVYLDTWYVIGPFAGRGDEAMQAAYPPEDDVDLDAVYPGADGRALAWRFTSRGFYPFVPPERRADAVYYAYTELRIDADRDVWLAIAADDESMLWLDDRLVWVSSPGDKPWLHPPYYARDELVGSLGLVEGQRRVSLSAGVHRLLFKLHNQDDHPFFSVVVSP